MPKTRIVSLFLCLALVGMFGFALTATPATAQDACPNAPAPRLVGESQGQVAQVYSSLRADVGSSVILLTMRGGDVFDITGEPQCSGPHYWYPVTFNGVSGWATEGYLTQYWLEPVGSTSPPSTDPTAIPAPPVVTPEPPAGGFYDPVTGVLATQAPAEGCPGAVAPRLTAGDSAQVAQVYSSLRPGIHSNGVLRVMRTGETMEVLDGPYCSTLGPFNWYQVSFNGIEGWATEGTAGAYWLQPASGS